MSNDPAYYGALDDLGAKMDSIMKDAYEAGNGHFAESSEGMRTLQMAVTTLQGAYGHAATVNTEVNRTLANIEMYPEGRKVRAAEQRDRGLMEAQAKRDAADSFLVIAQAELRSEMFPPIKDASEGLMARMDAEMTIKDLGSFNAALSRGDHVARLAASQWGRDWLRSRGHSHDAEKLQDAGIEATIATLAQGRHKKARAYMQTKAVRGAFAGLNMSLRTIRENPLAPRG